jgi:hypothetical protein
MSSKRETRRGYGYCLPNDIKRGKAMLIFKIALSAGLCLCLILGAGITFGGNEAGGVIPFVCVPQPADMISVDSILVNPYQQGAGLKVYFITTIGDSLREFEFNVTVPNGVQYADSFYANEWNPSNFNVYFDSQTNNLEVQGWGDTLEATSSSDEFTLVTLYFNVDDTVSYNQNKTVPLVDDVYFWVTGSRDTCGYDPVQKDGCMRVPDDSVWMDIGEIAGYSYQAYEDVSPKNTMYAVVPVILFTNLDLQSYVCFVKLDTSSYEYVDFINSEHEAEADF